jgi:hypothetical protein
MKDQKGMRWVFQKVGIVAVVVLASAVFTHAETLDDFDMTTFSPGTTIRSSDVNNNFQTLVNAMSRIGGTFNDSTITLSDAVQNLANMTVTPPMDGVVLFIATAHIRVDSTGGGPDANTGAARFCLTPTPGSCSGSDVMVTLYAPTAPLTTSLYMPVTMIEAVPCHANIPFTYYLAAKKEAAGLAVINGINFTRIFLPGAYQE